MSRMTFAAIMADYRAEKLKEELVGDWGSVVFYRLPAFALASILAPRGVAPNQVTLAGALLIPLMALAAWVLQPTVAVAAVTLMAVLFNVLDCADGSLARATGLASLTGRYLDFAADILYRITAYGCYGVIADRIWPGAAFPWLAVGLCCGVLVTYARVNRVYAEKLFPREPATPAAVPRGATGLAFSLLSGIDTLMPLVALAAWSAGWLWAAMIWFLLYTLADSVIEVAGIVARTRRFDRARAA